MKEKQRQFAVMLTTSEAAAILHAASVTLTALMPEEQLRDVFGGNKRRFNAAHSARDKILAAMQAANTSLPEIDFQK